MIGQVWRIAVMQGSLGHDDWPGWIFLEEGFEISQQLLKGHIHGLDDDEQHVCFGLKHG